MKNSISSFALVIIFFLFLFLIPHKNNLSDIKAVTIAGQSIKVDLALTREAREKGLSSRIGLEKNKGMLFIFENPGKYTFWMKDMNFAIDIIWIGEDLRIIYLKKNALPTSYPELYGPGGTSKYVLEIASGFSEKNNVKEGDEVEFIY